MKESQKGLEGPGVQVQGFQEGNQECFRSRPRPPTPGGQTFGVKGRGGKRSPCPPHSPLLLKNANNFNYTNALSQTPIASLLIPLTLILKVVGLIYTVAACKVSILFRSRHYFTFNQLLTLKAHEERISKHSVATVNVFQRQAIKTYDSSA